MPTTHWNNSSYPRIFELFLLVLKCVTANLYILQFIRKLPKREKLFNSSLPNHFRSLCRKSRLSFMKKTKIFKSKKKRYLKYPGFELGNSDPIHSVLEWIWIKGSYLSQWLPQGERDPLRSQNHYELKSSTLGPNLLNDFWKSKIFGSLRNFFFCFRIHKKLNKSWKKIFCCRKKNC